MAPKTTKRNGNIRHVETGGQSQASVNYGEVQAEEILALQAIYMDDFEETATKGAWSKADKSFKLTLRSFTDPEAFVILAVRLTATYPKSQPLLDVTHDEGFHVRTQHRVRKIIQERPKALLGEVMIHEIASEIQDALEDAVTARLQGTLPSLEDERANAEELAHAQARQNLETQRRTERESQEEEERMLRQMADELVRRRETKKQPRGGLAEKPVSAIEMVEFDHVAQLVIGTESFDFTSVVICGAVSSTGEQLVRPLVSGVDPPLLTIIKKIIKASKDELIQMEAALEAIRKLRHPGILALVAFRFDRHDETSYQATLCTEYADHGTLQELLSAASIKSDKARRILVDVLEALDYLHSVGVAHGNMGCDTIFLHGSGLNPRVGRIGHAVLGTLSPQSCLGAKWQGQEDDSSAGGDHDRRKNDIWMIGVIAIQAFLALEAVTRYSSPHVLFNRVDLSGAFEDFLRKTFSDSTKRPSAFELLPSEFLRTDTPALVSGMNSPAAISRTDVGPSPAKHRSRHNSSIVRESANSELMSRYLSDFTEIGRLGKGGFGEVVKARNKLDGGVYAIKKIRQAPELLDKVLSEVILLNRLNHAYVVRYYSTWLEQDISHSIDDNSSVTVTEEAVSTTSDELQVDFGYQSTGGLDFVSSGYPQIEFGEDDEDDDDDGDSEDASSSDKQSLDAEESPLALKKSRSGTRRAPTMLYIQMEYCERRTLRDLVLKGMSSDDSWKFVRQITEGLAHIHGHGIIHRDLKPDNIFIDSIGSPKIGDFGLATTGRWTVADRTNLSSGHSVHTPGAGEMTRSVGTALYVAPELRSSSTTSYNEKVDMYSLGVMFYEMCEHFITSMERIKAIQRIRDEPDNLPPSFRTNGEKAAQGKLIARLIAHKPSQRPSSTELLRSDALPIKIEDEMLRQAIHGLSDARSPYHQQILSALFTPEMASSRRVQAMAWDAKSSPDVSEQSRLRCRSTAIDILTSIFRRHGAEPVRRDSLFPRSSYYTNSNVVQLLDASGTLLQLPFDLILPSARSLAKATPQVKRTFVVGTAFRESFTGGSPRANDEVDMDIVLTTPDEDRAIDDAEILKVADEVMAELLHDAPSSIYLGHGAILDAVLDLCRVSQTQQPTAKEILSKLGFHQWTWSKVRSDLRKFGLSDTVLDDLQQFDFREAPPKAFARLRVVAASREIKARMEEAIAGLERTLAYLDSLSVHHKIYITPLASVNAKFYEGGMLFQVVLEKKTKAVIAAGGRYDSLIRNHHNPGSPKGCAGAVSISIGLDAIVSHMARGFEGGTNKRSFLKAADGESSSQLQKRSDVLVQLGLSKGTRKIALQILSKLWAANISAELDASTRGPANGSEHTWMVTVRHEGSSTIRVAKLGSPEAEELDVPIANVVSYLKQELRETSSKSRPAILGRQASQPEGERRGVHVLVSQHKSKKSNRVQIVDAAQHRWTEHLDHLKNAPILAVECTDSELDLIRGLRLSDGEGWRKAAQSLPGNQRQYILQVKNILESWQQTWAGGDGLREACVFNFRTGSCVYYDLGL